MLGHHRAGAGEEPAGAHAEVGDHRLEPGELEPAAVEVLPVRKEVAAVDPVADTVRVHAPDPAGRLQLVERLVEAGHYLLADLCVHRLSIINLLF